jgi:hypothetical protein
MGKVTRKRYSADFKAKVALEAIKGDQTLVELAAKHQAQHSPDDDRDVEAPGDRGTGGRLQ